jgi:hypothetical protein
MKQNGNFVKAPGVKGPNRKIEIKTMAVLS